MKKNIKNSSVILLALVAIIGLSGCAKYAARPLVNISKGIRRDAKEQSISFAYELFDKDDCQVYLGRNVLGKGYQPIQIEIRNNSDHYFDFSMSRFSLPLVDGKEVSRRMHISGFGRVFAYSLVSDSFGAYGGTKTSRENQRLDDDFVKKALSDKVIKPFTIVKGIVFIPKKSYSGYFAFTLMDQNNGEKVILSTDKLRIKV